ncbi:SixA phosphatase family protein [Desulfomarina sp.]
MKELYLIRHAKSSWADPDLDDFDRPLNKRGRMNAPFMAGRISMRNIFPDRIVSSPALRARRTARFIAAGIGYGKRDIIYDRGLYFSGFSYFLDVAEYHLDEVDRIFMVGHNSVITDVAGYLCGETFDNVPTCGIVGIAFRGKKGFQRIDGKGSLLFFDYPRKISP